MMVQDQDESIEKTELGYLRLTKGESFSPYLPEIRDWDLIGQLIIEPDDSAPRGFRYDTDERYVVDSTVRPERFRDALIVRQRGNNDHLVADDETTGYRFDASYIPKVKEDRERNVRYRVPLENPVWLADPNDIFRRI